DFHRESFHGHLAHGIVLHQHQVGVAFNLCCGVGPGGDAQSQGDYQDQQGHRRVGAPPPPESTGTYQRSYLPKMPQRASRQAPLQPRASLPGTATLNTKSSNATRPWAMAYRAAWVRSARPNLAKISLICFFTVDSVTFSAWAISMVPRPRPKAFSTSRWRSVRDSRGSSRDSTAPQTACITSGSM